MSRVQLALNVNDIDEAVSFYAKLFGTGPAKRKPGYANFAITEPPLKLVLLENPGQGGTLNHLGVEVDSTGAVEAEQARLAEAGLAAVEERDTTCCYAQQDKFWVHRRPRRRAVGDLHRPAGQPDLLGRRRRAALGHSPGRTGRQPDRAGHAVLRRPPGGQRGRRILRCLLRITGRKTGRTVRHVPCASKPVMVSPATVEATTRQEPNEPGSCIR